MTVAELIEELQKQLPNSQVEIYDPDRGDSQEINCIEADAAGTVVIYS